MIILSVFDGMSCGQISLKESGIKIEKYYASEIDKFAIKQTQHNFPNTIQLGDIRDIKINKLDKIDLLIGGSPCQGFSFAGKQLNFNDPRSVLFFEFVRLWNEIKKINPDAKFLLENVRMEKSSLRIISEHLGIYPQLIDSALVSAQNRKRYYWSNIGTKQVGLFNDLYTDVPKPQDKGILLNDILQPEHEVNQKYYLKKNQVIRGLEQAMEKKWKTGNKIRRIDFPNNPTKKAKTLTTLQINGQRATNHIGILCYNGKYIIAKNKSNTIGANYYKGIDNHQQRTGVCVFCQKKGRLKINYKIRRLTPTECARLQTIPDWYEWIVSDTQEYKMLGNGFTIEVIKLFFNLYKSINK